ncbi:MAG: nicotinate phosphoribosyltransferase [bacterium]
MARIHHDLESGPLFTDFYQLTMAQVYFEENMHETPALFEHFFRHYPDYGDHQAGYCINAGLDTFLDWLEDLTFSSEDMNYLKNHTDTNERPLFTDSFLNWLSTLNFAEQLTIEAIPEGRVVHPNSPLTVVKGPLAVAQLIETPLLNKLNFQTLIATKAARIKQAGNSNLLLEFGLRRAHGDGANPGTRAALIGGADFSSNTGVSYKLGFPPKGTHAHSLVQAYLARGKKEIDAFKAFARLYPDNCILLIDTIDTLKSGLPNAITVFKQLQANGHQPLAIRLDSGDLAHLAVRCAQQLNAEGLEKVKIVLSNQLDEQVLRQIIIQIREEAPEHGLRADKVIDRLTYGVGTRLITSRGDSSLGGVYKLVGLKKGSDWQPVLKISEHPEKIPTPGRKKIWRLYDSRGKATVDLIGTAEETTEFQEPLILHHPTHPKLQRKLPPGEISKTEQLHITALDRGKRLYRTNIKRCRELRENDLERLDTGVKRIINPHRYHVSLTKKMWQKKSELIDSLSTEKIVEDYS